MIAGYRIVRKAGSGGMGLVYEGVRDSGEPRRAAIKVIEPRLADDPLFRERFKREGNAAARIAHPHVIPIYEEGEHEGRLYIVMQYVEAQHLGDVLADRGRFEPADAIRLVSQVAEALDAAHEAGLIHRDVKPANVLVAGQPPNEHTYLTDFGITKSIDAGELALTTTGAVLGTADYIAPEHLREEPVGPQADVFALGTVLFELLTGELPFPRQDLMAKTRAAMRGWPRPRLAADIVSSVPPELDDVLASALCSDPADRYDSAGEFARCAREALLAATSVAQPYVVSHEPADGAAFAARLARELRLPPAALSVQLRGVDVEACTPEGDEAWAAAVDTCRALLVVMTPLGLRAGSDCLHDWDRATKRARTVIAVRTEAGCMPPFHWGSRNVVDFSENFDAGLAHLRERLARTIPNDLEELSLRVMELEEELLAADPADQPEICRDLDDLHQRLERRRRDLGLTAD